MTAAIPSTEKSSSGYTGKYWVCAIPPVYTGIWVWVVARQCARCWKWVIIIYIMNLSVLKNCGSARVQTLSLSRTCECERRARETMQTARANRIPERDLFVCVVCDCAPRACLWENAPTTPSYGRCSSHQRTPGCLREQQQIVLRRDDIFREKGVLRRCCVSTVFLEQT